MKYWRNIYFKNYFYSKKFILPLLLIFLIGIVYGTLSGGESNMVVAVLDESNSEYGKNMLRELEAIDSNFSFEFVKDISELEEGVKTHRYVSGYRIKDSLERQFEKGSLNNLIEVYSPENSLLKNLTNEIIYSQLFRQYSFYYLQEVLLEYNVNIFYNTSVGEVQHKYNNYIESDYTYKFEGSPEKLNKGFYSRIIPIDKILAFVVYVIACLTLLEVYDFRSTQLALNSSKRDVLKMENYILFCNLTGATLMALIVQLVFNHGAFSFKLILVWLNYIIVLLFITNVYKMLFTSSDNYVVYLPVLIIAGLLIPSLLVDLKRYFPRIEIFRYLFGPHYYIMLNNLSVLKNIVILSVFAMLSGIVLKIKNLGNSVKPV